MTRFVPFLFFSSLLLQVNHSPVRCSCNDGGPFLTVAPRTPLVVLVKINKYTSFKDMRFEKTERMPLSMQAEVLDIYQGKENRKQLTIWGDNGVQCRPYLSSFKENDYYVIALDSIASQYTDSKTKEYYISVCGTYWLNVDSVNKTANGRISDKTKSLKFHEIRQELLANDQRLISTDNDH